MNKHWEKARRQAAENQGWRDAVTTEERERKKTRKIVIWVAILGTIAVVLAVVVSNMNPGFQGGPVKGASIYVKENVIRKLEGLELHGQFYAWTLRALDYNVSAVGLQSEGDLAGDAGDLGLALEKICNALECVRGAGIALDEMLKRGTYLTRRESREKLKQLDDIRQRCLDRLDEGIELQEKVLRRAKEQLRTEKNNENNGKNLDARQRYLDSLDEGIELQEKLLRMAKALRNETQTALRKTP